MEPVRECRFTQQKDKKKDRTTRVWFDRGDTVYIESEEGQNLRFVGETEFEANKGPSSADAVFTG